MRKITLLITLVFSLTMFSSTSFADWTKVSKNASGDTYYVDFSRIRKVEGYVYYWWLSDQLKPLSQGYLSAKTYNQGDCKLFRFKVLSVLFHNEPMGEGTGEPFTPPDEWKYPPPESSMETIIKRVCAHAN